MVLEILIIGIIIINYGLLFFCSDVNLLGYITIFSMSMCFLYLFLADKKRFSPGYCNRHRFKVKSRILPLQSALYQRKKFISILKHDLKTPVIAQLRSLNLLLNGSFGSLKPDQKKMIELTRESCEYILDIMASVLTHYKFENNEIQLNNDSVNINGLVESSCSDLENLFSKKNITLMVSSSKDNYTVFGDKSLLMQAFRIILENSIISSYKNSIFHINLDKRDENIFISIINKGKHIPEDIFNKMFDYDYFNLSKYTKIGFDVKLYLALQIIKAHCGTISIHNDDAKGVVFDIILPSSMSVSSVKLKKCLICGENLTV